MPFLILLCVSYAAFAFVAESLDPWRRPALPLRRRRWTLARHLAFGILLAGAAGLGFRAIDGTLAVASCVSILCAVGLRARSVWRRGSRWSMREPDRATAVHARAVTSPPMSEVLPASGRADGRTPAIQRERTVPVVDIEI